jgi:hypothetical protein
VLRPSILFVLSKMAYFLSGFVNLPLKISQSGHLLLLPLYLLMDYLHVSDFLVQLLLSDLGPAAVVRQPLALKLSSAA